MFSSQGLFNQLLFILLAGLKLLIHCDDVFSRLDVVYPQDLRTTLQGCQMKSRSGLKCIFYRPSDSLCQGRFATQTDHQRMAKHIENMESIDKFVVMLNGF